MRAIQYAEHGAPDVLELVDVPVPEPKEGQVRVAVRAAGVNAFDAKARSGLMEGVPRSFPSTPGLELAGVVDAVGEGAGFEIGDEVFGWALGGSYAEYARAKVVARKPRELAWEDAVALPVAGETALRVLGLLDLKQGETLVVSGASGVVGTIATQVAVSRGVRVIGTASPERLADVRASGAEAVVYGEGLADRIREVAPDGVSAAFDTAGRGALPDLIDVVGGKERVITIADPAAFDLDVTFSSSGSQTPELLAELADLATGGTVRIPQAGSLPLAEAAEAHRRAESGHAGGKLILLP